MQLKNGQLSQEVSLFSHLRGSGSNANKPNGDSLRIAYRKNPDNLRLCVADGVTGRERDDLPEGYKDPAVYASETATKILSQEPDITKGIKEVSKRLHRKDLGFNSPRTSIAVVEIASSSTSRDLDVEIFRTGDCEIYTYRNGQGWFKELDKDMLSLTGRREFTSLCELFHPLLNEARDKFGDESREFNKIFAEFYAREQALLADPQSWDSPPTGRYAHTSLPIGQRYKRTIAQHVSAVLVSTDGAELDVDVLNEIGDPSQIDIKTFESRYKPWNDMAVAIACVEPTGR